VGEYIHTTSKRQSAESLLSSVGDSVGAASSVLEAGSLTPSESPMLMLTDIVSGAAAPAEVSEDARVPVLSDDICAATACVRISVAAWCRE
jgi:hypothetical protein